MSLAQLLKLDPPHEIPASSVQPLAVLLGDSWDLPYFTSRHPARADVVYMRQGDRFVRKPPVGEWNPDAL